jgi:hypothetical protein
MHAMNADETIIASEVSDIPLPYLGEFVKLLFQHIRQEVLARPKLSKKERQWFEGEAATFAHNFENILASDLYQYEVFRQFARHCAGLCCRPPFRTQQDSVLREWRREHQFADF